jgi:UDPglucose 6-dehydrogenase
MGLSVGKRIELQPEVGVNGAPHPDVVNKLPSILIVGYGHVGRQMARYFTEAHYVDVDGLSRRVVDDQPESPSIGGYKLGFICVPTPEGSDGRCDTSIVREVYARYYALARHWCVKSTVEIGTTESLGPNVCFSPEFYGETVGHPLRDEMPFVILGGPPETTRAFATAWSLVTNSYTRIYQTDARTAELVKLMENSWIATKVSFCNQFFDLAALAGVDYHELRELWLADPRVSRSHTYVYPNNRGWAGKCLPKDTANLCAWAREHGTPADLMEAVRKYNLELRGG